MQKFGETNNQLEKVLNEPYCPPPLFFHNNPDKVKEKKGV